MYFGSSLISAGQQEPARSSLQLPGQIHGEYRQQCAGSAESHALAQSLSMQLWWPLAGLGDDGDFCIRALKQLPHGLCFSMDENYILLPHGVNFQEAIFPDTQENRRMFASLFQFSNCSQAQHALSFSSDWEIQEDNRVRDLFAL